jgi:hypothetical protein
MWTPLDRRPTGAEPHLITGRSRILLVSARKSTAENGGLQGAICWFRDNRTRLDDQRGYVVGSSRLQRRIQQRNNRGTNVGISHQGTNLSVLQSL